MCWVGLATNTKVNDVVGDWRRKEGGETSGRGWVSDGFILVEPGRIGLATNESADDASRLSSVGVGVMYLGGVVATNVALVGIEFPEIVSHRRAASKQSYITAF